MLLLLFGSLILSLDPELADLASRARSMAKQRKIRGTDPSFADPGDYRLGSMSFSLSKRLSGSNSPDVAGYAVGRSTLAVIAPQLPSESVFVDADTQEIYEVRQNIDRDGDVLFYQVYRKNPLTVFTNIKFKSNVQGTTGDYNCSSTATAYSAGQCTGFTTVNLDPATGQPIAIPAPPINGYSWGSFTAGAKASGTGRYEVTINGLTDMQVDYALDIEGSATTGFILEGNVGFGSTSLSAVYFPVYGEYVAFFG
jgi:hypothetical protein